MGTDREVTAGDPTVSHLSLSGCALPEVAREIRNITGKLLNGAPITNKQLIRLHADDVAQRPILPPR
jgi:hypothetical protein